MAGEPNVLDLKNAVVKIVDGTGTPLELTLVLEGDGALSYTETYNREYKKNRGILGTVRDGDEEPMEVSFECTLKATTATAADPPTLHEALTKTGEAAAWVSTGGACEPYAVDIVVIYTNDCGTVQDETYTFPAFRMESYQTGLSESKITVSGKCNAVKPTVVRS